MATAHLPTLGKPAGTHAASHHYFSDAELARMAKDDSLALGIVSALLVSIVSGGFVLVGLTLVTILLKS